VWGKAELEKLGFSATTREITLYMEAVRLSTRAGDLTIKVQVDPDGPGPYWVNHTTDQIKATAVGVEFVSDRMYGDVSIVPGGPDDDNVIDNTDPVMAFARIGHWGDDDNLAVGRPSPSDWGLTGYALDATGTIMPINTPANTFIDVDPEKFFVRITDPSQDLTPGPDSFNVRIGTIQRSTVNADGYQENDDFTSIRVTETGNRTGVFVSRSQLLTMPDLPGLTAPNAVNDDDFQVHDGYGGGLIADDSPGDRTHRADVDGLVTVRYGETPIVAPFGFIAFVGAAMQSTIPVHRRYANNTSLPALGAAAPAGSPTQEERKILNVVLHNFNEPWEDNPVFGTVGVRDPFERFIDISNGATTMGLTGTYGTIWTPAQINLVMDWTRAYLSPVGIKVVDTGIKNETPTGDLFKQEDPAFFGTGNTFGFFDDFPDDFDPAFANPSRDEANIHANHRSAVNLDANATNDVIDIYFDPPFSDPDGAGPNTANWGSTWRPTRAISLGDPTLTMQVHVSLASVLIANRLYAVTVHELLHDLGDLTEQDQLGSTANPGLPAQGAPEIYFPGGGGPNEGQTIGVGRRISHATDLAARTSIGAQRLLRNYPQVAPLMAGGSPPEAPFGETIGPPPAAADSPWSAIIEAAQNRWAPVAHLAPLANRLADASIRVEDLPGTYLALATPQPNGTYNIAVDSDAAGFGWYVDATPAADEEFAELVAGRQFVAAAGSAAAQGVDLLTVLMHEFGHVLGLPDLEGRLYPTSLMTDNLGAGVRRVPSADDPVWAIVGAAPSLANHAEAVHGLHLSDPDHIVNGQFSESNPASSQFGWSTLGAAAVSGGVGVLTEDTRFNSRFSQTFNIPAGATVLSFTIQSADFISDPSGPPDAFEVALIDEHTGHSLLGVTQGLSASDAVLNIQTDGTTYLSSGVTVGEGSTSGVQQSYAQPVTVTVDLSGVTDDTTATLYFDLLGFGTRGSRVVIDNVSFVGVEQQPFVSLSLDAASDTGTAGDRLTRLSQVELVGLTNPLQVVALDRDGDGFDDGTTTADGSGAFRFSVTLAEGANTFRVQASDTVGTATAELTVQLDARAPSGQWTNAPAGDLTNVAPGHIEIQWAELGVAGLDLTTFGPSDITITGVSVDRAEDLGGGLVRYFYNDDGQSLTSGTIEVRRTAGAVADRAGNVSSAGSDSFVLDTLPPSGALASPAIGALTNLDAGFVEVQWTDAGLAGLDPASFGASDVTVTGVSVDRAENLGGGRVRYWYSDDGNTLPSGTIQVQRAAGAVADRAGNTSPAGSDSFVLDRLPPAGALAAPTGGTAVGQLPTYIDMQWTDAGPAGLDGNSFGTADISIAGVTVDHITDLGNGLVRYFIIDDGAPEPDGPMEVVWASAAVRDLAGNGSASGSDGFFLATNGGPVAVNDSATTSEDEVLVVAAAGVLANDTDPNVGDSKMVVAVNGLAAAVGNQLTLASGALVTLNADGSYRYDPRGRFDALRPGQTAIDSFGYTMADGTGIISSAVVTITIGGLNDSPAAVHDEALTTEDDVLLAAAAGVLTNDADTDAGDSQAVVAVNGQTGAVGNQLTLASGALVTLNADGSYRYDPRGRFDALRPGQTATDSFSYTMADAAGATSTAIVTLTIQGRNDAPVTVSDSAMTLEDQVIDVPAPGVLSNDSDAEHDLLTAALAGGPQNGSLTLRSSGSFQYTPFANYCGPDSFSYQAADGAANSAAVLVNIIVTCVNDSPVAASDTATTDQNTPVNIPVLANDAAGPGNETGQSLAMVAVGTPGHGTTVVNDNGTPSNPSDDFIVYTPAAGYTGPDSFTYTIQDNGVTGNAADPKTATGTVDLTVRSTQGTPGKITGGGSLDSGICNFGFSAQTKTKNGVMSFTGNLEFQDKSLGIKLRSSSITLIRVEADGIRGSFEGSATNNGQPGYTFRVDVEDRGEPGTGVDKFRIRITGPAGFSYDSSLYATSGGLLDGGNIQVHKVPGTPAPPSMFSPAGASGESFVSLGDESLHWWHSILDPLDVNADGFVSPIDALLVFNYLNAGLPSQTPLDADHEPPYLDTSDDGFVSAIDALLVINFLNVPDIDAGEGEAAPGQTQAEDAIFSELGDQAGTGNGPAGLDELLATLAADPNLQPGPRKRRSP